MDWLENSCDTYNDIIYVPKCNPDNTYSDSPVHTFSV